MEFTLDVTALGFLLFGGIAIGLIVGMIAGLLMRGDPPPPRKGLILALRLWRHKRDASLWVEVDENVAASVDDLPLNERAALNRLSDDLYRWLNITQRPPLPAPPPAVPSPMPPSAPAVLPDESQTVTPESAQPAPSLNPLEPFRQAFQARKLTEPAAAPTSIAAQVDEILQKMLAGSALEKRGIRLMELPGQGMVVMIGLEKFATVDDVPYDDVRQVLKAAVARWEAGEGTDQSQR
ncbi:MAG: hypothetical protein Fur0018_03610 [Anaerolineales bacterium]